MFYEDGFLHAIVDDERICASANREENCCCDAAAIRLHHFVSTVFRSELNVCENGAGYFIKNAPRSSSHHAILQGVVYLNGKACKLGRTVLEYGDIVSLQLEPEESSRGDDLVAWRGSEEVAKTLEGTTQRQGESRQGRMSTSTDEGLPPSLTPSLDDCEMIKYYREKLGKSWMTSVNELAITKPLPLTVRVLKTSDRLHKELIYFGFRPVTEEDFSLQLSSLDGNTTNWLNKSTMQELIRDTWIVGDDKYSRKGDFSEKRLGIFLSEARVTGELMQQELSSMLPVSIMAAHLKKLTLSREEHLHFLDLCSAPGSKTNQLLTALDDTFLSANCDFAVVANELSPQRANLMKQRLVQQSGSKALSHLIVACADGRAFSKMEENSFNYILCDVPCSGDGTIRKSPKILSKWSLKNAEKNKPLQKELLEVGLHLLKPQSTCNGGLLLYSTCSLNPLENEEVLLEVMDELNGNKEDKFRFELVDLSEESSIYIGNRNGDKSRCGNYLRVLPAKAHGGFFLAAIKKLAVVEDDSEVARFHAEKESTDHDKYELVRQHVESMGDATISYAVSPCTQRCCADIVDRLDVSAVISSGVAVLYESKSNGSHILQQGCATLMQREHIGCVKLSHAEFIESITKSSAHREMLLPRDALHGMKSLAEGTPLIIKVCLSSSEDDASFLLPARTVQVSQDDSASEESLVRVQIHARPQIFRRLGGVVRE